MREIVIEESIPPKDPKAQRIRSWANVIATSAALITAFGALFRPQDMTVNKASYDELKKAVEQLSVDNAKNHDDIVSMRSYMEGARATGFVPIQTSVDAGTQDAGPATLVTPASKVTPPLPPLNVRPQEQKLPDFDSIRITR